MVGWQCWWGWLSLGPPVLGGGGRRTLILRNEAHLHLNKVCWTELKWSEVGWPTDGRFGEDVRYGERYGGTNYTNYTKSIFLCLSHSLNPTLLVFFILLLSLVQFTEYVRPRAPAAQRRQPSGRFSTSPLNEGRSTVDGRWEWAKAFYIYIYLPTYLHSTIYLKS